MTGQNGNFGMIKPHWWLVTGDIFESQYSTETLKTFQTATSSESNSELWKSKVKDVKTKSTITLLQRSVSPIHLWGN